METLKLDHLENSLSQLWITEVGQIINAGSLFSTWFSFRVECPSLAKTAARNAIA